MNIYQSEEFRRNLRELEYQELKDVKSLYERQQPRPEEELFLVNLEIRRRNLGRSNYENHLY
ncbi:hypothetical protein [Anaerococcus nagyae]|uniref:hypothetical protein n=1 Tax=Anaerococcus nagyae TaxID=1755241 RepID=UPI003249E6BC